jgi:hypothetical protein
LLKPTLAEAKTIATGRRGETRERCGAASTWLEAFRFKPRSQLQSGDDTRGFRRAVEAASSATRDGAV